MSTMGWCCYLRSVGALLLLLLLTACEGAGLDPATSMASTGTPPATSAKPNSKSSPRLRFAGGDKIRVVVFGEEKFSGEYLIDTDGTLSLPLVGTIDAAGLGKTELEQAITNKLKGNLRNPKVTVEVVTFRPFYVLGEVQKPGEFQYRSGLNVLGAIAMAGGATYRANNAVVLIQRAGSDEFTEYPQSPTVPVLPGDVVRLRERFF
jgi:protein involved in polysaccharide export with SLBB domain